ncbi:hypothetical protein [Vampirovibrio chlorellavorus]|uniref:hypothetical protein n=1 Tax=Vampirovibrio chlorellavorus TaxID=758823 RepID=UPI0026EF604B|nr:hypothetical protein [Vampirovibrio chlorellavorus]
MMQFQQRVEEKVRQKQLKQLSKQIQGLRNEMEFVEILAQFWPLPNMSQKMERLQQRLALLDQQYQAYQTLRAS